MMEWCWGWLFYWFGFCGVFVYGLLLYGGFVYYVDVL